MRPVRQPRLRADKFACDRDAGAAQAGRADALPREITVTLQGGFDKPSRGTRVLRGRLDLSDGTVRMVLPGDQGNVVLSSAIGCDAMAIVPAGSGKLEPQTVLKGFVL